MRSFIVRSALALVTILSLNLTVTSGVEAKGCPNWFAPTSTQWATWRPELGLVNFWIDVIDRDQPNTSAPLRIYVNGQHYTDIPSRPGVDLNVNVQPNTGLVEFYYLDLNQCVAVPNPLPPISSLQWKRMFAYWF